MNDSQWYTNWKKKKKREKTIKDTSIFIFNQFLTHSIFILTLYFNKFYSLKLKFADNNFKFDENGSKFSNSTSEPFNSWPNDKILDWSTLKAFADNKINVTEKLKFVLGQVENIMEKGENAGNQHFLLFP